ncbi:hypothetical protein [Leisingera aquaemixtae]|nr:hypothetical protein [Leisingera aquaemixtae]
MILAIAAFLATGKNAAALTAQDVMENMSAEEQNAYISGVVEGLAFARWLADERDETGMQCIWNWYLHSDQRARFNAQMDWFEKHPEQQVSTLMYALIREECGEQGSRR